MNCPICNQADIAKVCAKYLPMFFKCPSCSGYYNLEKKPPTYQETYFTETGDLVGTKTIFSCLLNFFLLLREKRIRRNIASFSTEILDYGCGNGKLVRYLKDKGFKIDGYDPSDSAVNLAQDRKLPVFSRIPDKKYGLMMFWHSLEHTDQPWLDIQNCRKHLASEAKLIIAVPNADSLEAKFFGPRWFCYDWPFHRIQFTYQSLKKLLEGSGFRIVSVDYLNLEYTASSLVQTFLNLFLPKNILYTIVSNRRKSQNRKKMVGWLTLSALLMVIFSPLLIIFFLVELITKKTAAIIMVAQEL